MEEKMFDLMTQMYVELQGVNGRLDGIDDRLDGIDDRFDRLETRFDGLETRFDGLETEVAKIGKDLLRLEDKVDNTSKALFDGYTQTYEKIVVVEKKVDILTERVERQDVEIRVIKNVAFK